MNVRLLVTVLLSSGASVGARAHPEKIAPVEAETTLSTASPRQNERVFLYDKLVRLVRWNGQWMAKGDEMYAVNVAKRTLVPARYGAVDTVLDVAESPKLQLLFGARSGKAKLLRIESGKSAEIRLPEEVTADHAEWRLAAEAMRVVLFNGATIFSCEFPACRWSRVDVGPGRPPWPGRAQLDEQNGMVLYGGQLFDAVDHGEWGGGLWAIDLASGKPSLVENDADPATGLVLDSGGRLWATWGLMHGGGRRGTLRVLELGEWRLVSRSNSRKPARQENWPLDQTSFESVATDRERLFVLTSTLGVVELVDGSWHRRTTDWPDEQNVSALAVDTDIAILASDTASVVIWNLRSGEKQVVRIQTSPSP